MSKALGKGLSALIPDKEDGQTQDGVAYLPVTDIQNNSLQPRTRYDAESLNELKASIQEKGVLQPILVRPRGSGYEVVAGERRLRAVRELGLEDVPVILKDLSDQEALVVALVENIQREELNPIEEAEAFRKLISDFQYTQESVAQSVGKDRTTITNTLRLLRLPETIQGAVADGKISTGHARALLSLDSEAEQQQLLTRVIDKGLSVRDLERLVKRPAYKTTMEAPRRKTPDLVQVEEGLQKILGTKVHIDAKAKGGKIVIEYYSPDDLSRVVKLIIK